MPSLPDSLKPYAPDARPSTLVLLTTTIDTACAWLLVQFVASLVVSDKSKPDIDNADPNTACVFFTVLRDAEFWRNNARRSGCDLTRAERDGRIGWVDSSKTHPEESQSSSPTSQVTLESAKAALDGAISKIQDSHPRAHVCLVLDGLDFTLASGAGSVDAVMDAIYDLRGKVNSMMVTTSADAPLIHRRETPLEVEHALLLTSLAHQASYTISLRQLSTGAAKDVSGVLRITKGTVEIEPKELLYLVGRDGSAKVFERGSAR